MAPARPELPQTLPHLEDQLREVEARRNSLQAEGQYALAGKLQEQLEATKLEHESAEFKALAEKHEHDLHELEHESRRAFDEMIARHDYTLIELRHTNTQQEAQLAARHDAAQEEFKHKCEREPVRHRASKQLLDLRVQEEHLRRQCNFHGADKVKAAADALQSQEIAESAAVQIARQEAEEAKLLVKQQREMEVLKKKAQASFNELLLDQERELERMKKKMMVAKTSLQRTQAQERLLLEQAFRGWYNPRRILSAKPQRSTTSQISYDDCHTSSFSPHTARSTVGSVQVNSTHLSTRNSTERHTPFTNLSTASSSPPATPGTPTTGYKVSSTSSSRQSSLALALQPKSPSGIMGIMSLARPQTSPMRRARSPSRAQHQNYAQHRL